jgi:hypothetical protein
VQIETLTRSVQLRAQGLKPGDAGWPEAAYNGDYIQDIADDFLAGKTVQADDRQFTASGDAGLATVSASLPWPICATSRTRTCRPSA